MDADIQFVIAPKPYQTYRGFLYFKKILFIYINCQNLCEYSPSTVFYTAVQGVAQI